MDISLSDFVTRLDKPVIVQVFDRDPDEKGTIIHESGRKYVGTLVAYSLGRMFFTIKIKGLPFIYVNRESEFVEVFSVE